MSLLSQAKTLGGIGSLLVLLTCIPSAGPLLGIVGFILTLIAVKYISDAVGDRAIFNNMIISVVLSIVGVIAGALLVFASVFRFMGWGHMVWGGMDWHLVNPPVIPQGDVVGFIGSIIAGLVVIWISLIISAVFLRRSYTSIARRLNVGMFSTAALIFLIGAATTIVVIGFLLIFVAQILLIVAFFSIPEQLPQATQGPPATATTQ